MLGPVSAALVSENFSHLFPSSIFSPASIPRPIQVSLESSRDTMEDMATNMEPSNFNRKRSLDTANMVNYLWIPPSTKMNRGFSCRLLWGCGNHGTRIGSEEWLMYKTPTLAQTAASHHQQPSTRHPIQPALHQLSTTIRQYVVQPILAKKPPPLASGTSPANLLRGLTPRKRGRLLQHDGPQ